MFDWTSYLGHRVIVRLGYSFLVEVVVMETSAQGRVKFKTLLGNISWNENNEYTFVEDLGECLS